VEAAITDRTRAIVPVHYAGVACEMDALCDIAARHRLLIIEDAPAGRPEGSSDPGPNLRRAAPALTDVERVTGDDSRGGSSAANAPATIVSGRLASAPRTSFRIELFASDPDAPGRPARAASLAVPRSGRDGARLLAAQTVTTDSDGGAELRFEVPLLLSGGTELTATATDPEGNTSELSLPLLVPGATISWKNAVDGNWDNTGNWNPAQIPGASDTADISLAGTYTVTFNANATIAGLTLGGASGTQTLSITGGHTLTLNGAGSVGSHGDLEILASGVLNGSGNLTIDGALDWVGGSMAGTGATTVNGALSFTGTGQKSVQRTVNSSGPSSGNPSPALTCRRSAAG